MVLKRHNMAFMLIIPRLTTATVITANQTAFIVCGRADRLQMKTSIIAASDITRALNAFPCYLDAVLFPDICLKIGLRTTCPGIAVHLIKSCNKT
jgi:hypothetical protein